MKKNVMRIAFYGHLLLSLLSITVTDTYARTINGTIIRSAPINTTVELQLSVTLFDQYAPENTIVSQNIVMSVGQTEAVFTLEESAAQSVGLRYALAESSKSQMVMDYGYYNQNGTTTAYYDYNSSHIPAGSDDIDDIQLNVIPAVLASGNIELSAGAVDPAEVIVFTTPKIGWVCQGLDRKISTQQRILDLGNPSDSYSLKAPGDGQIFCLGYETLASAYYPRAYIEDPASTVPIAKDGTGFSTVNNLIEKNITMLQAQTLSGSVSLPDGATYGVDAVLQILKIDEYGQCSSWELLTSEYFSLGIEPHEFNLSVPALTNWCLRYVTYDSGDFVSKGYAAAGGTTSALPANGIGFLAGSSGINIEIIRGKKYSGTLSLPENQSASDDMWPAVVAFNSSDGGCNTWSLDYYTGSFMVINAGDNSTNWSISLPSDEIESFCLQYRYASEESDYWPEGTYSEGGSTRSIDYHALLIDVDNSDPAAALKMIPAYSIGGKIYRDSSDTATTQLNIRHRLGKEYDGNWDWIGYPLTMSAGQSYLPYSYNYPGDIVSLKVGYEFRETPPSGFAEDGWYSSTGTVDEQENATALSANMDHTEIDLHILYINPIAPGDINGDGDIDLVDLMLALQITTSTPTLESCYIGADVDGDQQIGIAEALFILNYLATTP